MFSLSVSAQTKTWIGGAAGTWSAAANWSPSGTPVSTDTVIFNSNAAVSLDINLTLGSLRIINNANVELNAPATRDITLYGTSEASPALLVENGSTFIMSTGSSAFHMSFATAAKAWINGMMICKGTSAGGDARLQADVIGTNRIYINGTYLSDVNSGNISGDTRTLFFNAGSVFQLNDNGGTVPNANWDSLSTIKLTGVTSSAPVFLTSGFSDTYYGSIEYDCSSQANDVNLSIATSSTYKSFVRGNFSIKNTGLRKVSLATNLRNFFIKGNFEVAGPSAVVSMGNGAFGQSVMEVWKNFTVASGNTFSMQDNADGKDTLRIGGDLNIAGTITSNSNAAGLLELNGAAQQQILSSFSILSTINLKINNAAGIMLKPNSFSTAGKLYLTSGIVYANSFSSPGFNILNTDINAIEGGSANSYIDGYISRSVNTGSEYNFPVGRGGRYRPCVMIPATSDAAVYNAEYFDVSATSAGWVTNPLAGTCNTEYWQIKTSVNNARIKLSLDGVLQALPRNPNASDTLVLAKYIDLGWQNISDDAGKLYPGNASSGDVLSGVIDLSSSSGSAVTFGFIADVLPIRLISFSVNKKDNKSALIKWTTDGLEDKGSFELMRSTDGRNFISIKTVPAVLNKTDYSFIDNNLPAGMSYYKLKMTDRDNKITWSDVRTVVNIKSGIYIISVSPTATTSNTTVKIFSENENKGTLLICNTHGAVVQSININLLKGETNISINAGALAKGLYKVFIITANGKTGAADMIRE